MLKLLSSLFNITVTAEYVVLIAAILLLRKKRTGVWRLFIVLLFEIVAAETLGWAWHVLLDNKRNGWIFNINLLLTDIFLLWILSNAEPMRHARKQVQAVMVFFVIASLCNFLFFQGFWNYNQYTDTAGDIVLIVTCCYFFYSVITETTPRNLFTYEYFWLVNGVLVFSLGSTILYIFPEAMSAYRKYTHINIFGMLNYILNVLLYSSLIIAFICRNRNTR